MIAIVDYGMGNLRSVEKGFEKVGVKVSVTSDPKALGDAHAVVLPGVGAFKDCVCNLDNLKMTDAILRSIEKGKPFLGICLGLQVLFEESEEFGLTKGLGILKGKIRRFPQSELKVPHMGWNTIKKKGNSPILRDIEDGSYFYFVHSYYALAEDASAVSATTDYGLEFTSAVSKDNIMATQFHPEKSQALGLKILKSFADFAKKA